MRHPVHSSLSISLQSRPWNHAGAGQSMADRLSAGSITTRTACRHGAMSQQLQSPPRQPSVDMALLAATSAVILLAVNGIAAFTASLPALIIQMAQRSRDESGHGAEVC